MVQVFRKVVQVFRKVVQVFGKVVQVFRKVVQVFEKWYKFLEKWYKFLEKWYKFWQEFQVLEVSISEVTAAADAGSSGWAPVKSRGLYKDFPISCVQLRF